MNKMFSKAMAANHEKLQHTLRRAAIGAASVGVLLNLISIVYCSKKRGQHSMIDATGFAFLPVSHQFTYPYHWRYQANDD